MAFNDVIPVSVVREMLVGFQPALPLYTPRYSIPMEYVTSVPDMIKCELTDTGTNWSSHGTTDHPSFARLRNHLEAKGLIQTSRNSCNGDIVLSEFYLNDVRFNPGDRFLSASAMKYTLERAPKEPMKKKEEKVVEFDGELRDWTLVPAYGGGIVAKGRIYNDKKGRFEDGEYIHTSVVESVEGNIVRTKNSVYELSYA